MKKGVWPEKNKQKVTVKEQPQIPIEQQSDNQMEQIVESLQKESLLLQKACI